jgi:mitochondrial fission protein ELM1
VGSKEAGASARTIWILTHGRLGDLGQMQELSRALGWPTVIKGLAFHPPNIPILASLLLDRRRSDRLEPPWPDLLLCAEGRSSVIAREVSRRSGGRSRVVCLGRPAGSPSGFDLVLTTAQYRLPESPNIVELALPLAPSQGTTETDGIADADLTRPVTAVLVGGTSLPERLDGAEAVRLADGLVGHANRTGGTLLVITGPRTGSEAAAAIAERIRAPHIVHKWQGSTDSPYRRFLTIADDIMVTSDSVSMAVDALATGKPVSIYRLGRCYSLWHRILETLYRLAWAKPARPFWAKPIAWLFDTGLIEVRADRLLLFDRLASEGRVVWFGEEARLPTRSRVATSDVETAVAAVERLFPSPKPGRSQEHHA